MTTAAAPAATFASDEQLIVAFERALPESTRETRGIRRLVRNVS